MSDQTAFTKRNIDALKPGETLWDDKRRGLCVRCRKGGAKTLALKYRVRGRQRWFTIGAFGNPWTVETARKRALDLMAEASRGIDPAAQAKAQKKAVTVKELCDQYLETVATVPTRRGRVKTPGTIAIERGHIARHILPLLGRERVTEVTRQDVAQFQQKIAAGATKANVKTKARGRARVRGGQGTAARCLNTLGAIFAFAVRHDLRPDNPVHGVVRFQGKSVKKFLNPDEMKAIGQQLAAGEDSDPHAMTILRLLALTGARRNEIASLRWPWVDAHHGVLRLPTSKTGERLIILGKPALDLITALPRFEGTDFVFPGRLSGSYYQATSRVWSNLRDGAKVQARIHDLRHHFASLAAELGYQLPTISALLGHSIPGTTGRYLHHTDKALKEAADRIAAVVDARLAGRVAEVEELDQYRGRFLAGKPAAE